MFLVCLVALNSFILFPPGSEVRYLPLANRQHTSTNQLKTKVSQLDRHSFRFLQSFYQKPLLE